MADASLVHIPVDTWLMCGVKAEIRNRCHSYYGAAKQIKLIWTHLKKG